MKKLLLIFLLFPVFVFGQANTITIDSVSIVEYSGYIPRTSKPKPKKTLSRSLSITIDDAKKSTTEVKATNDRYQQRLRADFPNYNAERDMPLPIRHKTILDKEGRFHPSTKWETYQTFNADSAALLIDILDCNLSRFDTVYTTEVDGSQTMKVRMRSKRAGAMCFSPGLAVLCWSEGKITTFYSICFHCHNVAEGPKNREYKNCILINALEEEVKQLGYLKPKE